MCKLASFLVCIFSFNLDRPELLAGHAGLIQMTVKSFDLCLALLVGLSSDSCNTAVGKRTVFMMLGRNAFYQQCALEIQSRVLVAFAGVPCVLAGIQALINPHFKASTTVLPTAGLMSTPCSFSEVSKFELQKRHLHLKMTVTSHDAGKLHEGPSMHARDNENSTGATFATSIPQVIL